LTATYDVEPTIEVGHRFAAVKLNAGAKVKVDVIVDVRRCPRNGHERATCEESSDGHVNLNSTTAVKVKAQVDVHRTLAHQGKA
jgi:hypothetical protein